MEYNIQWWILLLTILIPHDLVSNGLFVRWEGRPKCSTGHDHIPDQNSCHHFYHCWGSRMTQKSCGPYLMFHPITKVCDWPSIVANIRPMCDSGFRPEKPMTTLNKIEQVPDIKPDIPKVPLFTKPKQPAKPIIPKEPSPQFERPVVIHNEPIDIEPVLVPIDEPIDPPVVPPLDFEPQIIPIGPEPPPGPPFFAIPEQFNPVLAVPPNLPPPPIRVPLTPPVREKPKTLKEIINDFKATSTTSSPTTTVETTTGSPPEFITELFPVKRIQKPPIFIRPSSVANKRRKKNTMKKRFNKSYYGYNGSFDLNSLKIFTKNNITSLRP